MYDDEQKSSMAGKCGFMMLSTVATAAWILNLYSLSSCNFAERYVTLSEGVTIDDACAQLGMDGTFGPVCDSLLTNTEVGFWGFEVTVPVDQRVCYGYTITMPWGYVDPYFDTKFNSARALIVTAATLGGAAWLTLMFSCCCRLDAAKMKCMGLYFSLAMLFQGLGLLFLSSSACNVGFFATYFPASSGIDTSGIVADIGCNMSTGAKCAISATVLYLLCNCLVGVAVPPEPILQVRGGGAADDQPTRGGSAEDAA
jgi:hypothetical protein